MTEEDAQDLADLQAAAIRDAKADAKASDADPQPNFLGRGTWGRAFFGGGTWARTFFVDFPGCTPSVFFVWGELTWAKLDVELFAGGEKDKKYVEAKAVGVGLVSCKYPRHPS